MTTINSIEDLARILKEQPTWADAIRALVLTEDLLDLPARFDRFVQAQGEFNARLDRNLEAFQESNTRLERFVEEQREINRRVTQTFESIEGRLGEMNGVLNNSRGRLGNLEGREYERSNRSKALSRSVTALGFSGPYVALNQDGHTDSRFIRAVALAVNNGTITRERSGDLFEADVIVANEDNRHAVFEISITADNDDIHRAKARAEILAEITGGEVIPAVITANLNEPQREQAEAEKVSVFVVPYP